MKRTKTGSIGILIFIAVLYSVVGQGCHLGKKDCGCGMDLNSTTKHRHHWL